MARIYCHQCGTPLPKRAKVCMQCDTPVVVTAAAPSRPQCTMERLAICCVALSSLVFVVSLGITNLFRDGHWYIGVTSFAAMILSISWVKKYENANASGRSTTR